MPMKVQKHPPFVVAQKISGLDCRLIAETGATDGKSNIQDLTVQKNHETLFNVDCQSAAGRIAIGDNNFGLVQGWRDQESDNKKQTKER